MWLIVIGFVLSVVVYIRLSKILKYWEDRGVRYPKPQFIVGNMGATVFRTKAISHVIEDIYKSYPKERYIGCYQFFRPALMLRDPELIKQITVKDFDTFPEHTAVVPPEADLLWSRNLAAMTSKDGWHDMRSTLSPSFTSSKMKTMYSLIEQCAKQFVDYFKIQANGTAEVELKDAFTRFTNDVIATAAFGIACDSLKDKNNQFYLMGKDASNFSGIRALKMFGYSFSPLLMKIFKVTIFSTEVRTFFSNLIQETLKIREEKKIIRPDMIHLLMEARKGRLKYDNSNEVIDKGFAVVEESHIGKEQTKQKAEITDDDITAQALIFFLAGFETASTLMCYIAYELAVNPDLQKILQNEIKDAIEKCNGRITYEVLLSMKYLDNVVSETLRLHPPAPLTERNSIRPYTINSTRPDEKPLHLEQGTNVWIPIHAIHMDPQHYANPKKFDPDRFSDENKHKIKPYTYLPFGAGPRNCIGSRFALLETKLIIVELLRSFEFVPIERTQIPIKLSASNVNPLPDGGFWLGLRCII